MQSATNGLARQLGVFGQPHHPSRQQLQRPAGTARRGLGTGRRHQQCLLFSRKLPHPSRARLFAQGSLQIPLHKSPARSIYRRNACSQSLRNAGLAVACIRRQQNLRTLQAPNRLLASPDHLLQSNRSVSLNSTRYRTSTSPAPSKPIKTREDSDSFVTGLRNLPSRAERH